MKVSRFSDEPSIPLWQHAERGEPPIRTLCRE
jgi:hypothetical protein